MANKKSFETALAELEKWAQLIASPDLSLEEAMEGYEKGIAAYQECLAILDDAEQKITTIEEALANENL